MKTKTRFMRGNPQIWKDMAKSQGRSGKVRRKFILRAVKVLCVLAVCLGALKAGSMARGYLAKDPAFTVSEVVVLGLQRNDPHHVIGALADLRGRSLMGVDESEVAERLAEFAWIKGFLCRKHLPDTLVVEVTERTLMCTLEVDGRLVEVDGDGNAWQAMVNGGGAFRVDGSLDPRDLGLQALVCDLLGRGLAGRVVSILPGERGTYRLVTRDGWILKVDPCADLGTQWSRFDRAVRWIGRHHPERRSLDLRWEGKIVLEAAAVGGGIING